MTSLIVVKITLELSFCHYAFSIYCYKRLRALKMPITPDVIWGMREVGVEGRVRVMQKGWVTTEYYLAYFFTLRAHPPYFHSREVHVSLN